MKIQIIANTPVGVYYGRIDESSAEQYKDTVKFMTILSKGKLEYIEMQGLDQEMYYFNSKVIEASVFTLKVI